MRELNSADPDLKYNQVIRPWKSRLGLLYVDARPSVVTDVKVIALTVRGALDRASALSGVYAIAQRLGASPELLEIITRRAPLPAGAPPGASEIVQSRAVVA